MTNTHKFTEVFLEKATQYGIKELSRDLGMPIKSLYAYGCGRVPPLEKVLLLCDVLGISLDCLVDSDID